LQVSSYFWNEGQLRNYSKTIIFKIIQLKHKLNLEDYNIFLHFTIIIADIVAFDDQVTKDGHYDVYSISKMIGKKSNFPGNK